MRSVMLCLFLALGGCAPPMWTEMLGESIKQFTSKNKIGTGGEKVWVTSQVDNACDRGCPMSCGTKEGGGGTVKAGGLFGAFKSDGSSSHDKLAYEVISNFLTQKKKMKVLESHRHNYAVEMG